MSRGAASLILRVNRLLIRAMTKNAALYVARPLFLACGHLATVAAIAVCGYILIRHFGSLPRVAKVIAVVLHPLPFVLVQLLLFRAFYYFVSDRSNLAMTLTLFRTLRRS